MFEAKDKSIERIKENISKKEKAWKCYREDVVRKRHEIIINDNVKG